MWAFCRDWQFCISIFLHLLSTFSITAWPNVSLWLLCHENNTLRAFEIIPSTSFYHGYIYRRLVRWDSKKLVWLSILLKSSQSDLFSRNLVLSRAVFDGFSFGFRCFLILLRKRERVTMSRCLVFMFSHDWKFRGIDGKVTKICSLMRRETSSLRVITYFDSFAYRIWFGSWIRLNVRDSTNLPLPSPQNSQRIISPG